MTKLGILIVVVETILSILRVCTWWAHVTKRIDFMRKIEEAGRCLQESNPGHLWLELPVLEVSLVQLPVTASWPFHYFLITSKFLYF